MTNLKQKFTDTFMEMLNLKCLDSITVTDIVGKCGVSRQSFYYYFDDIYDLVEYFFQQETDKVLREYSDINSWEQGFVCLLKWAQVHKPLVMHTHNSLRRDSMESFMDRVLYPYLIKIVEEQAVGMRTTRQQREFIAHFYTQALNALSLDWIRGNMQQDPEFLAKQAHILLDGSFKKALTNFQQYN